MGFAAAGKGQSVKPPTASDLLTQDKFCSTLSFALMSSLLN
jgi:hypothetical protein